MSWMDKLASAAKGTQMARRAFDNLVRGARTKKELNSALSKVEKIGRGLDKKTQKAFGEEFGKIWEKFQQKGSGLIFQTKKDLRKMVKSPGHKKKYVAKGERPGSYFQVSHKESKTTRGKAKNLITQQHRDIKQREALNAERTIRGERPFREKREKLASADKTAAIAYGFNYELSKTAGIIDKVKGKIKDRFKYWLDLQKQKFKKKFVDPHPDIPTTPTSPEVSKHAQQNTPDWIREALTTGVDRTDADGNVIGYISPQEVEQFIEKNPPVSISKLQKHYAQQAEDRGPADKDVKEHWDRKKEEWGPADKGIKEYWANQDFRVNQEDVPQWIQDSLETGMTTTDDTGKVTGHISSDALKSFKDTKDESLVTEKSDESALPDNEHSEQTPVDNEVQEALQEKEIERTTQMDKQQEGSKPSKSDGFQYNKEKEI